MTANPTPLPPDGVTEDEKLIAGLLLMADAGDYGRKPDPTSVLRRAAARIAATSAATATDEQRREYARAIEGDSDNPLRVAKANRVCAGEHDDEVSAFATRAAEGGVLRDARESIAKILEDDGYECLANELREGKEMVIAGRYVYRAFSLTEARATKAEAANARLTKLTDAFVASLTDNGKTRHAMLHIHHNELWDLISQALDQGAEG